MATNGAELDPYRDGGIYINPDGAMAQEPLDEDYMLSVFRERAIAEGAETVVDEANFVYNAIFILVDQNGITRERGEDLLFTYVQRYINGDF